MKEMLFEAAWIDAVGATRKPQRLKLLSQVELFIYPAPYCENESHQSKGGSRKKVFTKHGWYDYSEDKPDIAKAFP